MNKVYFGILVALAGFFIYMKYVKQKESAKKLREGGENLAKGLHRMFINSVSPRLRDGMKIHASVEKIWRREGLILRQFSRVVIEIFLFSEEISEKDARSPAMVFIRESAQNNGNRFLVGLKITTNQENEGSEIWKE